MSGLGVRETVGDIVERTVQSEAVHAGFAVVALGFAAALVFDATSTIGMAHLDETTVTPTRPL